MSAESAPSALLRQAAAKIRKDWPTGPLCPDGCVCEDEPAMTGYHKRAAFHEAVAVHLDKSADAWDRHGWSMEKDREAIREPVLAAMSVARAYLDGEAS